MPIVAKSLANNLGISVIMGKTSDPRIKGDIIYLPDMSIHDEVSKHVAYGYVGQQAFHIKYGSSVPAWENALHQQIYRILEEVRVESKGTSRLPGVKHNISQTVRHLIDEGKLVAAVSDDHAAETLCAYVEQRCRQDYLQQDLGELPAISEATFKANISAGLAIKIDAIVFDTVAKETSNEVWDGTLTIVEAIKIELEEEKRKEKNDGDNNDEPKEPQIEDQSQIGPSDDSGANQECDSSDQAFLEALLSANEDEVGTTIAEMMTELVEEKSNNSENGKNASGWGSGQNHSQTGKKDATNTIQEAMQISAGLRNKLSMMFEAPKRRKRIMQSQGKRISPHHLYRAAMGDSRIFYKKLPEVINMSTAMMLLIDQSYSMGKSVTIASSAALGVAMAIDEVAEGTSAIAGFPGVQDAVDVILEFDAKPRSAAEQIAAMTSSGGTPISEAFEWACQQLSVRPEVNKYLSILTDFDLKKGTGKNTLPYVQNQVNEAEKNGIRTMVIGIETPWISEVFPRAAVIHHPSEIIGAMQNLVLKSMT